MDAKRNGSHPSGKDPADRCTRAVRIGSPFQGTNPTRVGGGIVTFEPGARLAWHTHALGRTPIATAGSGWVQREGGLTEEARLGDTVWVSPSETHRHGATAGTAVTHVAIAEGLDGSAVTGMGRVAAAQDRNR